MKLKLLRLFIMTLKLSTYGFLLQAFFISILCASSGSAQYMRANEIFISSPVTGQTIKETFDLIEAHTDFKLFYIDKDLKSDVRIKLSPESNRSVYDILLEVSKQSGLKFRQVNNVISASTISKKDLKNQILRVEILRDVNISGKVTDENGQGLPGASVVVKGTTNGTTTNLDGNYSLNVPEEALLSISFVGYKTQEIILGNQTVIDIQLEVDAEQLEEIVVIGYGTQKQKDITGSISSIKGEELSKIPVSSLEQSLSGKMSGVQVINGSGVPGAGATIRVRGVGTLNNNEPLYVIDGVILGNIAGGSQSSVSPLSMINPSDIESIDVLKDASATAIYGARAGNGVVIITTKRGTNKKTSITYEAYTSTNVIDGGKYNQMSGPEWAGYFDKDQRARGFTTYQGQAFIDRILGGENIPTYDWIGELTRNGKIQSHNVSVTGGGEKSNYFTSLSYFDQTGVVQGSDMERFTLRFNSDHHIGNKLKFGNTLLISRSVTNQQGNIDPNDNANDFINRGLSQSVYRPIYRADGTYAGSDNLDPDSENLLDQANMHIIWNAKENINLNAANRVWSSAYLDYEIIEGLVLHTMGSVDFSYAKREDYNDFNDIEGTMLVLPENTRMSLRQDEDRTWLYENTLTFKKTFLTDHSISALAGFQVQNTLGTFFSANDGAFENTDYWFFNRPHIQREITDGDGNVILLLPEFTAGVANGQAETGINSFFGRFFYDYKGKYLLTATVRRDGSSKFGSDRRWGTFPALSAAWRISEESFMPDVAWLGDVKLRAGYGISGSDNVSNYQYASSVGQGGEFNYSFNGGEIVGTTINRLGNTFIQWEQIKMSNIALDIGLLKGRINVVADFYNKTTSDLFLPFAPALELGNEQTPNGNLGEVNNKGVDIAINSVNLQGELSWTSSLVFGTVKNKIIKLPENADRFTSDGWQNNLFNISRVGEEIGALYGYVNDGIFQTWDEVYDHAYQDQALIEFDADNNPVYDVDARDEETGRSSTAPGDFRYKDLNGDGFIDSENDRKIIGSTIPDFTWGLTNNLSYKGISLSVFFQGVQGVSVYNTLKGNYLTRERLNAWDGEGSTNTEPRIAGNGNGRTSSYRVENASYVRLKNLRIAYDLPQALVNNIGMNGFQIYATGTNLFTITDYTGYDPEVGLRSAGENETAGIDKGQYPLTRQFTLGARITF